MSITQLIVQQHQIINGKMISDFARDVDVDRWLLILK